VQKLLLRLASFLFALTIGGATTKVHRFFLSRKTAPQAAHVVVANEVATETTWRCDVIPKLPRPIKVLLDKQFPGWQFPGVSEDDCQSVKTWGGKEAYAQLTQGDFDGDGRLDYAVLIEHGSIIDRGVVVGARTCIVAFFHRQDGYKMKVVTREGGGCLQLMRRGESDYDYEAQREFTYKYDTMMSGEGMGGTSYLYENGKFRAIITSD
jgi:hypothetical protein